MVSLQNIIDDKDEEIEQLRRDLLKMKAEQASGFLREQELQRKSRKLESQSFGKPPLSPDQKMTDQPSSNTSELSADLENRLSYNELAQMTSLLDEFTQRYNT